ncbi:hypothetical protein SNEBB_009221 [Seison nebaliae]|nr:hypothetical protein SNEBB_009221 [Seison nebaliae]
MLFLIFNTLILIAFIMILGMEIKNLSHKNFKYYPFIVFSTILDIVIFLVGVIACSAAMKKKGRYIAFLIVMKQYKSPIPQAPLNKQEKIMKNVSLTLHIVTTITLVIVIILSLTLFCKFRKSSRMSLSE